MGREILFQDNVGKVEFPAWFKHPEYLRKTSLLVWGEVDRSVGDDHIEKVAGKRDVFPVNLADLKVCHAGLPEIVRGPDDHIFRQIDAADQPAWADRIAGDKHVKTCPAAEIQHPVGKGNASQGEGIANPAEGLQQLNRSPVDDGLIIAQFFRPLPANGVEKSAGR